MKECKECEFFNGYDYSDGTPHCSYEENGNHGYEYCPYNDCADVKKQGMRIEIDVGFMHDYILHTMKNTIENQAYSVAVNEVKSFVGGEIKQKVISETETQIKSVVQAQIADFMSKDIVIGGGWREPERTLSRQAYLAEVIEKELETRFKSDAIKSYAEAEIKKAINAFERKLKDEINEGIKTYFNEATRQVLTENVVSMLMCNETYKNLSNSMQTFLPENKNQEA